MEPEPEPSSQEAEPSQEVEPEPEPSSQEAEPEPDSADGSNVTQCTFAGMQDASTQMFPQESNCQDTV